MIIFLKFKENMQTWMETIELVDLSDNNLHYGAN